VEVSSTAGFLALAARQMRHVLIDHARKHHSLKAGGQFTRVDFSEDQATELTDRDSLLALDQALDRLRELDQRALSVVELKFFGGFTNAEAGRILNVTEATVEEDWQFARSWLYGALTSAR
jgi:RNA polymerase sigma factor (TIGR02999 family)